jgi:hypothetical protein
MLPIVASAADPVSSSCLVAEILGDNRADRISAISSTVATNWTETNRAAMTERLETLLSQVRFAGGSVFVTGALEGFMEHHLVALRLEGGEIAGVSLRYEWGPEAFRLVEFDFKQNIGDLSNGLPVARLQPVSCD